ncbi:MAG: HigA family addiction module antitoxin [Phycisphaerales bacterium JB060]
MTRMPAEVASPGEHIREELEERGWTQSDLATILGRPLSAINQIINAKKSITPDTARELGEAFGTSAELWLNLESSFRLAQASDPAGNVRARAKLFEQAPVSEMQRRGWIARTSQVGDIRNELLRFYGVSDEVELEQFRQRVAARKGDANQPLSAAQCAWLRRIQQLSTSVQADAFSKRAVKDGLPELKAVAATPEEIHKTPAILARMGIRLVVVEHLSKTKVDGIAFWLSSKKPVIGLSLRYDRIDYFWFTLFHELGHIYLGHVDPPLDDDIQASAADIEREDIEREADRFAASMLIPADQIESFILRKTPLFSKKSIIQFANRIHVHPGVVVGQLQHRGAIGYSHSREMLVKVRSNLIGSTLTDGWGQELPAF